MPGKSSYKTLEFCNFKLTTLLKVTQAINDNLPTKDLLSTFEKLLRDDLHIGKLMLFMYSDKWIRLIKSGFDKNNPEDNFTINIEKELLNITEIGTTLDTPSIVRKHFDLIVPVKHNDKPLAYVLLGDIEEGRGVSPSIKHLSFIQTLTNIIVVAIENRRLHTKTIAQETMKKELELASKMQSMLIPNLYALPNNKHVYVDAYYFPHFEVGGDYYDFFKLNDKEYGFCIADVSGKGISAALLMSNFQANLRALFTIENSLTVLVKKLNERVISTAHVDKFITLFIGKYNHETRELSYINAGHNPPILYDKHKKEMSFLEKGCIGLGMVDEIPVIAETIIKLDKNNDLPGEGEYKLLCYTDGLVELRNENLIEYGTTAIEEHIQTTKRIDKTINDIILSLHIQKQNDSIFDDISILGIEFF